MRRAWDVISVKKGNGGGLIVFCLLPEVTWEQLLELGSCRSARWEPFVFKVHRKKATVLTIAKK